MRALRSTIARLFLANDATPNIPEAMGKARAKCSFMSRWIMQARTTRALWAPAKGPTPSTLLCVTLEQ
jgi:hypothetical protein